MGVDLLFQGEFLSDGQPVTHTRKVKNPREAAAYTFGYNYTLFAQRVHDVLSVIQYARNRNGGVEQVHLIGFDGGAAWAAAARAQAGDTIHCLAIDSQRFRFGSVSEIQDVNFLPGAAKYGDLPGLLALGAPGQLWLAGEGSDAPGLVRKIYALAGASKNLSVSAGQASGDEAAKWLLRQP